MEPNVGTRTFMKPLSSTLMTFSRQDNGLTIIKPPYFLKFDNTGNLVEGKPATTEDTHNKDEYIPVMPLRQPNQKAFDGQMIRLSGDYCWVEKINDTYYLVGSFDNFEHITELTSLINGEQSDAANGWKEQMDVPLCVVECNNKFLREFCEQVYEHTQALGGFEFQYPADDSKDAANDDTVEQLKEKLSNINDVEESEWRMFWFTNFDKDVLSNSARRLRSRKMGITKDNFISVFSNAIHTKASEMFPARGGSSSTKSSGGNNYRRMSATDMLQDRHAAIVSALNECGIHLQKGTLLEFYQIMNKADPETVGAVEYTFHLLGLTPPSWCKSENKSNTVVKNWEHSVKNTPNTANGKAIQDHAKWFNDWYQEAKQYDCISNDFVPPDVDEWYEVFRDMVRYFEDQHGYDCKGEEFRNYVWSVLNKEVDSVTMLTLEDLRKLMGATVPF